MRLYTIEQLRDPATYSADAELATLARKIARATWEPGSGTRGDWTAAHLAGSHAEAILPSVEAAAKAKQKADKAVQAIRLPAGWKHVVEGQFILLEGPLVPSLPARFRRLGGEWDSDRRLWRVPASKAASLRRVIENATGYSTSDAAIAKKTKQDIAEIERWLGFVEDKVALGYVYERGVAECNKLGIAKHEALAERLRLAIERATAKAAELKAQRAAVKDADRERRSAAAADRAHDLAQRKASRLLVPVQRSPALNRPVRLHGSVVVVFTSFGKQFRIGDEDPSVYGSHLLGHEGEWGHYAYHRPATETEVQELDDQERAAKQRAEGIAAVRRAAAELAQYIQSHGERPPGNHLVEGQRAYDSMNIYGGGTMFVIADDYIWFVQNNGGDGDNWNMNNVQTGGAGAIGWRIPSSEDLANQIRALGSGQGEQS